MQPVRLDEETRAILRQILERQAYRQLMAANIRGHGLQYLSDLEDKLRFAGELDFGLRVLRQIEDLYHAIDGGDLHLAVHDRMERIPYPESRLDLAACLALTERAERVACRSYEGCVSRDFAAIAKTLLEFEGRRRQEEQLFTDFCADAGNGPRAQQLFSRWFTICVLSFGRPGTRGDARAVALGLRSKHSAEVVRDFVDDVESLRKSCHLELPALQDLGVELPEDLRSRFSLR